MKDRKEKAVCKLFAKQESENVPDYSPFKKKYPNMYTSFVRRRSSMVHKMLTSKPETAVAILKHVWDQEYNNLEKKVLMNKYWTRNASLAELMLDIGKYRAHKDNVKLLQSVNKLKQKYNSLRQACRLADISWTKFHRHTYIPSEKRIKKEYTCKLTQDQIESIQQHFESDDINFPLPDKKLHDKWFLRFTLKNL